MQNPRTQNFFRTTPTPETNTFTRTNVHLAAPTCLLRKAYLIDPCNTIDIAPMLNHHNNGCLLYEGWFQKKICQNTL